MKKRARAARKSSVVRSWFTLNRGAMCATAHYIHPGEQVLCTKVGHERAIWCRTCAKLYKGEEAPPRPFVFRKEGVEDVKDRQAGRDD